MSDIDDLRAENARLRRKLKRAKIPSCKRCKGSRREPGLLNRCGRCGGSGKER